MVSSPRFSICCSLNLSLVSNSTSSASSGDSILEANSFDADVMMVVRSTTVRPKTSKTRCRLIGSGKRLACPTKIDSCLSNSASCLTNLSLAIRASTSEPQRDRMRARLPFHSAVKSFLQDFCRVHTRRTDATIVAAYDQQLNEGLPLLAGMGLGRLSAQTVDSPINSSSLCRTCVALWDVIVERSTRALRRTWHT